MSVRTRYQDRELICDYCNETGWQGMVVMRGHLYPDETRDMCQPCFIKEFLGSEVAQGDHLHKNTDIIQDDY